MSAVSSLAMGVAGTVLGAVASGYLVQGQGLTAAVDHGPAKAFLQQWFTAASRDPGGALDHLTTPNYRAMTDVSVFDGFWNTVDHVADVRVAKTSNKNVYAARWTFVYKKDKKGRIRSERPQVVNIGLVCAGIEGRIPFRHCSTDEVRLDDTNPAALSGLG